MRIDELKLILTDLLNDIAVYIEKRSDDEICSWLMAATLRIWSANKLFSENYLPALSIFDENGFSSPQVITALDCAGEDGRELNIPAFFKAIVDKDKANRSNHSRNTVIEIDQFLVSMALVTEDFTLKEAGALRSICNLLIDYCDFNGIIAGKDRDNHADMVTPLNISNYHQRQLNKARQSAPLKSAPPLPSNDHPASQSSDKTAPNITLSINLSPSLIDEEDHADAQSNSAVTVNKPAYFADGEQETLESVLAELDSLVGLSKVKEDVHSLLNFIKICQLRIQRGMKVPTVSYHLVFTGNPGTGKTTVARMVAKLYYQMGILPQGQLVETDRSGLVAGYLGQTAIKTQKVIQEALGGVLFIDEAYSLANDNEDSYGKEAIETLLKAMEDHREELVVIVAGYDELMHKFIDSNPGLRSRFNKYFYFPDYSGEELLLILKRFCDTNGYSLAEDSIPILQNKLNEIFEGRSEHFGNARTVRNIFEHAINHQANRLVSDSNITDRELSELTLDDILSAMEVV